MLTLRQMQIFCAVVEHGSFRTCAEKAGISQVVVSSHIKELEKNLGTKLFDRKAGQAATLTDDGKYVFSRVSGILKDLTNFNQELASRRQQRPLEVWTYGFIMFKRQERLERFRRQRPSVNVHLGLDPPDNKTLPAAILHGEVDLACFFALDENEVPGSHLIGEERLSIYVGPDHPLAGTPNVTGEMLRQCEAIVLPPHNPQRKLCDRALAAIDAQPEHLLMETVALALMLDNVRRGRAWICLFEDSIDEMFPGLVKLDLAVPLPIVQVRLLTSPTLQNDLTFRELCAVFEA